MQRSGQTGGTRAVGVEEELFLVDPDSWQVTAVAPRALRAGVEEPGDDDSPGPEAEIYQQQIETATEPFTSLSDLRHDLSRARRGVTAHADAVGAVPVAVSTPVLEHDAPRVTPDDRYRRIRREYGALADDALVCGMHVHVDVHEDELARVMDGIRPWLPVLLAVSANSPFHRGVDTGHASWRYQVWSRWPTAGPNEPFGDRATYDDVADRVQAWGAALDPGMLYFDVRPAAAYPTLEIRVADVCTELDDAVLVAALARALVTTLAEDDRPPSDTWRTDLLRAAAWRAAKVGVGDQLVHPVRQELAEAREVVTALLEHTRPALEAAGDADTVHDLVEALFSRGSGATRQRAVHERSGELSAVMVDLAERTSPD